MRTMLKVCMDVEAGNHALQDKGFEGTIQPILDRLHPEAAYFLVEKGKRTAYVFFDLADVSDIPSIAEPLFTQFKAEIEIRPVMNREDLIKGLKGLREHKAAA